MTLSELSFTTEAQRAQREFSYDPCLPAGRQSGDGDWIIGCIPSGTESGALLAAPVHRNRGYW
jgi:hypothetical protein